MTGAAFSWPRALRPLTAFVGGRYVAAEGTPLPFTCPVDDGPRFEIDEGSAAAVDGAVQNAHATFQANRRAPSITRIELLNRMAAVLEGHVEELALLIACDVGKPIRLARGEVARGAQFARGCAAALSQLGSEVLPLDALPGGAGHFGFTRRVPFGVVAAITPFNAPINLLVQKLAPAIAGGNAVVAKPAPAGTRVTLRLAELLAEAGLPAGLFNVVVGDKAAALALVRHPLVRAVTFTGGVAGAEALLQAAGAKKFVSELGSNAANVVLADADIEMAARKIAAAAFEASGQQCISAQRVIVEQAAFAPFVERFVAASRSLRVGPAHDPATDVGPMVSAAAAERVRAMCDDAISRGARYALEPVARGALLSPAILVDVAPEARLWTEEVFGPVALVRPARDVDDALALANDSPFGLQGAVFTRSLDATFRFSEEFDVGALWVNEASRFRLDTYPFGGMKASGVGREGVRYAIEELTQLKFTGILTG